MKVSIIIPVYNTKYEDLEQCVESILQQSISDFEIILVDDGSGMVYQNLLDRLQEKDSRIRIFHKENEGVSVARNFGVSQARGEYILFVDADDLITPWVLESGISCIEKTDCDVVIGKICSTLERPKCFPHRDKSCTYELIDTEEKKEKLIGHIFAKNCSKWKCDSKGWEFNGEGCWAHFMKKNVAQNISFIPGIAVGEDTIWALDMLKNKYNYRIIMLDEPWYYYIQNNYSMMNKYNPNIVEQLSKPVAILDSVYGKTTGFLYESYIDWILIKLKQICYRAYLSDECHMSQKEKHYQLSIVLHSWPWKQILYRKTMLSEKKKIKLFLFRNNIMLYIYAIIKKIRSKK